MADGDEAHGDGIQDIIASSEREQTTSIRGASLGTPYLITRRQLPAYYTPLSYPNKILSLPTELTSTIFEFADNQWVVFMRDYWALDHPGNPWNNVPLRPGFEFLHVCRQWRQIALGCKSLWATFLHVTPNKLVSHPLLSFYLAQSRSQPLDIVIRVQNFSWPDRTQDESDTDSGANSENMQDDDDDNEIAADFPLPWSITEVRRVLDALIPHAARWRRFALNICMDAFDHSVLIPIQTLDAPLIGSLEVLAHNQRRVETLPEIPDKDDFIEDLRGDEPDPSRHRITVNRLKSARFDIPALHMLAPSFVDLTVLELRNSHFIRLPRKVYTNIFGSAPRLVHVSFMQCRVFDVEFDESLDADDDEDLTMVAPCLEVLRSFASDMDMYMWKYLDAPRLKDVILAEASLVKVPFWITGAWDDDFEPDDVRTPFPALERLVLQSCGDIDLSDDQLLLLCRMTSAIEQLVLINDESMLDLMLSAGPNPLLWPNLRVLKLAHSSSAPELNTHAGDVSSLAGLVEWRREVFGVPCVIEVDRFYFYSTPRTIDDNDEATEAQFRLEIQENIVQFHGLVRRGLAQVDPTNHVAVPRSIWPPLAGQERPVNISNLWHVDMLGARRNPWY